YPPYLYSGAGLFISAQDLATFVDAFAAGKVVKPASVDAIWTKVRVASDSTSLEGLGNWWLSTVAGSPSAGSEGGARASVVHLRKFGLTIAVTTNTQGADESDWIDELIKLYAK